MCAMRATDRAGSTTIQLFGGLRMLRADGHVVDLGSRKQRMVLLALALRPNDLVTTDELVDHLWGDSPPRAALTSLRSYLSNLRKSLTEAAIDDVKVTTRSPGYVLEIAPTQIDLTQFRHDATGDTEAMDRALGLASRSIVPEFSLEEMTQPLLRDIDQELFDLQTRRIEVALEAGEHLDQLAELGRLVEGHPLDERVRSLQIVALYRAGRQADALASYSDARERLLDELGLDPSPELQDLERRVLEQDPDLLLLPQPTQASRQHAQAADPVPEGRPTHRRIIGRAGATAAFEAAAESARRGQGRAVVVRGAAGLGKSHFVASMAERLEQATVAWGRCSDAEGVPALWPWLEVSERLGVSSAALDGNSRGDGLLSFTRELATALDRDGDDPLSVVIIEDMHWIDEGSALLLRHLAGRIDEIGALLVITSRDVGDGPLATLLADLSRLPTVTTLQLQPLTDVQIHELIEASIEEDLDVAALDELAERSSGNPLYALQLARSGAGRSGQALPRELAQALEQQIGAVSETERQLLEAAACCAGTIDPELLATVTGRDPDSVVGELERATRRGLIRYDDADPNRFRFAHVLLRDALYDSTPPRVRARHHADIGRGLASDPREVNGDGAELARHFGLGASAGVADEALHWNHEAGRRALARADHPNALLLLRRATELAEITPIDPLARADILRDRGVAARNHAEVSEAEACLLESFRLCAQNNDADRMGAVALELSDGTGGGRPRMWWRHGELPLEALRESLTRLEASDGDPLLTLEVRAHLAADDLSVPLQDRANAIERIATEAADLGDAELIVRIEIVRWLLWARLLPPSDSLVRADQAIELARSQGLVEQEFVLRRLAIVAAAESGDPTIVDRRLREARTRADLLGLSAVTDLTRLAGQMWLTMKGAFDEAIASYSHDIEEVSALGPFATQTMVLARMTAGFWRDGESSLAQASAVALSPTRAPRLIVAGLSMLAAITGDLPGAKLALNRPDFDKLIGPENLMGGDLSLGCSGYTLADVGTDEQCARAYEALQPLAGRLTSSGPAVIFGAQADTALGRLARRLGRLDEAKAHIDNALRLAEGLGAHLLHLIARVAEAEIEIAQGNGDTARLLLDDIETDATQRGIKAVANLAANCRASIA